MVHHPRPRAAALLAATLLTVAFPFGPSIRAAEPPAEKPPAAEKPAAEKPLEKLPPALTHYKGREIAQYMSHEGAPWLIRTTREKEEECQQMLQSLKIQPGQVLCDLGCGNGFYTLELAHRTGPKGKVFAVDIQPEMLQLLRARAKDADLENVSLVLGTLIDPKLPDGKLDLVLLVDVYHEFSHPVHMLQAIRKSLKPDGRLVLVEFRAEDPKVPIKPLHKMSKEQVLKELEPNGFKLVEQYDKLPWQHVLFFQRAEAKDDAKEGKDGGGSGKP